MTLSTDSKFAIAETLKSDFFQFVNETYDVELSELLADAALDFMSQNFGGQIDPELENELATAIISEAYISL